MILTIIIIALIIIGFFMLKFDVFEWVGLTLFISGVMAILIIGGVILCEHISADARIEEKRIEYESLCERYEIITSEYEDMSKSDVIKDIAEWNKNVYSYKYWAYNPWTSWFFSKQFADELEMIER